MLSPEKMNRALCRMLPELIDTEHYDGWLKPATKLNKDQHCPVPIHWESVGLQVCHEIEQTLGPDYAPVLYHVCVPKAEQHADHFCSWAVVARTATATFEQRREAICRFKFPKKFRT